MPDNESPELKKALDEGRLEELPPNVPPGLLGDRGLKLSKKDPARHGLNAGLTDEWDGPAVWMLVVLLYFVFFPAAYWVLWRSTVLPARTKIGGTVIMTVGLVMVFIWVFYGAPPLAIPGRAPVWTSPFVPSGMTTAP